MKTKKRKKVELFKKPNGVKNSWQTFPETVDLIKAMKEAPIHPTSYYSFRIQKKLRALDKARIIIAAILLRKDADNFNDELMQEIIKFQKMSK